MITMPNHWKLRKITNFFENVIFYDTLFPNSCLREPALYVSNFPNTSKITEWPKLLRNINFAVFVPFPRCKSLPKFLRFYLCEWDLCSYNYICSILLVTISNWKTRTGSKHVKLYKAISNKFDLAVCWDNGICWKSVY